MLSNRICEEKRLSLEAPILKGISGMTKVYYGRAGNAPFWMCVGGDRNVK